jgi:hypothetical protein
MSPRTARMTGIKRPRAGCTAGGRPNLDGRSDMGQLTAEQRFWANVDKGGAGGCWLWTGKLDRDGYANFSVNGRRVRAHRFAYELLVGAIPEGLQIDHVKARGCTHRHCVNPAHLEPVTNLENTLRSENFIAQHARKTHCQYGHEFTPENTETYGRGRWRRCVTCRRRRDVERRARTVSLTAVGEAALRLLDEHGEGDVWHEGRTRLVHGTPALNLRAAQTLNANGVADLKQDAALEAWGTIAINDRGRAWLAGARERQS